MAGWLVATDRFECDAIISCARGATRRSFKYLVGLGNGRNWDVPEARRDTGANGNRRALQFYFHIMSLDDGDFGSRKDGDAAGIARLADGKEGCV
jgi:hypothetical protein